MSCCSSYYVGVSGKSNGAESENAAFDSAQCSESTRCARSITHEGHDVEIHVRSCAQRGQRASARYKEFGEMQEKASYYVSTHVNSSTV